VRREITGISFLCALHYLNLFPTFPIPDGRILRRASCLVLVGDQDVIQIRSNFPVARDSTRTADGSSLWTANAQALGGSWQKILESTRAPLVPSGSLSTTS